uniref:Uncharacterized protein n=1 Tax=Glossina brevipalpis TaxID=37001 RepID=A0A1A9W653_9MUSC
MVNSRNINNYNNESGNDNNMVVDITRPVSMYDNLNMTGTVNTPKIKASTTTTTTATTTNNAEMFECASFDNANIVVNDTAATPFAIPQHELNGNVNNEQFLIDDNKSNLFQTPNLTSFNTFPYKSNTVINEIPAATGTLPSLPCLTTKAKSTTAPQPVELVSITSLASSLPEGPAITTTITTTTITTTTTISTLTPQTTKSNTSLATISTTATQQRPLSQHSQSELNETGHNIAAVKAALNEAKSKFFGLNGYKSSQQDHQYQQHQHQEQDQEQEQKSYELIKSQNLLSNNREDEQQQQQLQVQIKIQPKYQNIPENSALFRRKDMRCESNETQTQTNHNNYQHTGNNKQITTTPTIITTTATTTTNPNKMPVITSYKHIPLNDVSVDNTQPSQLILSGIVSLTLLRYLRNKRNKTREHCFIFLRTNAYVLAVLSALLCCMALILASAHYNRLTADDTKCESINVLLEHGSCICTFHAQSTSVTNASELLQNNTFSENIHHFNENNNSYKIEYR